MEEKAVASKQSGKVYRVGVLVNRTLTQEFELLRIGMARLGYVEGSNVVYEPRVP